MIDTENPWTAAAIANDYHLGSSGEAALIARENGTESRPCGKCAGTAWYRGTVGAFQCTDCRALLVHGPAPDFTPRWT